MFAHHLPYISSHDDWVLGHEPVGVGVGVGFGVVDGQVDPVDAHHPLFITGVVAEPPEYVVSHHERPFATHVALSLTGQ